MPMSICENGHTLLFRPGTGVSLKHLRCHLCGSALGRAEYVDGRWVPAPKKTRHYCEKHRRYYFEPGGCWRCRLESGKTGFSRPWRA